MKSIWYSEGEIKYELAGKCQREICKKICAIRISITTTESTIELNFQILCKYYEHNSIIWN